MLIRVKMNVNSKIDILSHSTCDNNPIRVAFRDRNGLNLRLS